MHGVGSDGLLGVVATRIATSIIRELSDWSVAAVPPSSEYVAPVYGLTAFTCPHCGTVSQFRWEVLGRIRDDDPLGGMMFANGSVFSVGTCTHCTGFTIWHAQVDAGSFTQMADARAALWKVVGKNAEADVDATAPLMIYPGTSTAPMQYQDLPHDLAADYTEASSILYLRRARSEHAIGIQPLDVTNSIAEVRSPDRLL